MASISRGGKFAIVLYLLAIHLLALFFVLGKINVRKGSDRAGRIATINTDSGASAVATVSIHPADSGTLANDTFMASERYIPPVQLRVDNAGTGKLLIPVAGVKRKDLQDTYTQSRAGGRVHNAIDIIAKAGTPVVAAADGEIAKFFDSKLGGITIYQWSTDKQYIYYYAHLQQRAAGIAEKQVVKRGTVIGYVGDTGDAGPGNYHLHFGISTPLAPGKYWGGADINPYPILKAGLEAPAVRE